MPRDFKLAEKVPGPLRRVYSMTFWVQAAAFVIVGGSLLHGGIRLRSAEPPASVSAVGAGEADAGAVTAATGPTDSNPAGTGVAASVARAAGATPALASAPSLESAQLALSTID